MEGQRDEKPGKGWQGPSHQVMLGDVLPCEFLGPKRAKQKGAYLRSFREPRWGIREEVLFRCLEGGRFRICLLTVKMALLRTTFMLTHRGCRTLATGRREQTPASHLTLSPWLSSPACGAGSKKQRALEPGCLVLAPLAPVQCLPAPVASCPIARHRHAAS